VWTRCSDLAGWRELTTWLFSNQFLGADPEVLLGPGREAIGSAEPADIPVVDQGQLLVVGNGTWLRRVHRGRKVRSRDPSRTQRPPRNASASVRPSLSCTSAARMPTRGSVPRGAE
jgi:hypothetical protein